MERLLDYGALGLFCLVLLVQHFWLTRIAIPRLLLMHQQEREREREAFLTALAEMQLRNEQAQREICRRLENLHEDLHHLGRRRESL